MAKSETAAMPKMPKPSMRMDMPAGMDMSGMKPGQEVHCEFSGTIKRMEIGKDYEGKMRNTMEIEHDPKSVKITGGKKKRTAEEITAANERL